MILTKSSLVMRLGGPVRQQSASFSRVSYRGVRLDTAGIEVCTILFSHKMISSGIGGLFSTGQKTESTKLPAICSGTLNLLGNARPSGFPRSPEIGDERFLRPFFATRISYNFAAGALPLGSDSPI